MAVETERATAPGAPSAQAHEDARLRVVVLESEGTPAERLPIALLDAKGVVLTRSTDAQGAAEFIPAEGSGTLFVRRRERWPFRATLELAAGERVVRLPRDAEISGVARENGAPLTRSLELKLLSHASLRELGVPSEADEELGLTPLVSGGISFATNERGEFRVEGLPAEWSGSIQVPMTHVLAQRSKSGTTTRTFALDHPARGLALELERLPYAKGRIVEPDGTTPVAGGRVRGSVRWESGTYARDVTSGEDGHFELPLRAAAFERLDLVVCGPNARNPRPFSFQRADLGDALDLGDLALALGRTIHFRVVDAAGAGIADAAVEGNEDAPWVTADSEGRGMLAGVPATVTKLVARAQGYADAELELPPETPAELVIAMRRCNLLSIEVRAPKGSPPVHAKLQISAEGAPLSPRHPADRRPFTWELDDDAPLPLWDLTPDVPILVRTFDAVGTLLRDERLAPLGPSEERHHVIELSTAGCSMNGRVVGPDLAPVVGAFVTIWSEGQSASQLETNSAGEFHCGGLFAREANVLATKEGFAEARLAHVALAPPAVEVELRMERGHDVEVQVEDARGRSVEGGFAKASDAQGRVWYGRRDHGALRLMDLPPTPLTIELELAGARYTLAHEGERASERFVVPAHGRVRVESRIRAPNDDTTGSIELVCSSAHLDPLRETVWDMTQGVARFPSVLPGEYEVLLYAGVDPQPNDVVLARGHVTVVADENASVELRP